MNVRLSELAVLKLNRLLTYLETEWGLESKKRFLARLEASILAISRFPKAFPESAFRGIHKCVVTKQTSLFYRVQANQIEVITVFDTRQNPDELAKEIGRFR